MLIPELRNLECINLPSLAYQRGRGDMIQTHKILYGTDDINKDHFFTAITQSTGSHKGKLYKTPSRPDIKKSTFSHCIFQDWNDPPH